MDEDLVRQFERQAQWAAAQDLRATLGILSRDALLTYLAAAGGARGKLSEHAKQSIRRLLVDELRGIGGASVGRIRTELWRSAKQGIELGARSTGLEIPVSTITPVDIRQALNQLGRGVRQDLAVARKLARYGPLETQADLHTMLAAARKAATRIDRAATWIAHRSVNEGVRRAASAAGAEMYWQPERDACLTCLAYAGQVVRPDQLFSAGLTFGDSSTVQEPIPGPPAHPHCRCQLEPWLGSEVPGFDLPQTLRREAQRSVLAGTAQGSEPARLRAADRLLSRGDLLVPKTVQQRARRALADRRFADRRRTPA